ncbi:MAG TPA: hypothetical protein VK762_18335 [Polyangiaceae bacterium]|jgi:hypothetical protein|nr:hypothetical protein [Polyangiaceae bacterium]
MPLRVLIDGRPLPEPEARALWQRFSAWMEAHSGDLGGFARTEGFASVHPELHGGEPVLVASLSAPQRPYTSAPAKRQREPASSPRKRPRSGR